MVSTRAQQARDEEQSLESGLDESEEAFDLADAEVNESEEETLGTGDLEDEDDDEDEMSGGPQAFIHRLLSAYAVSQPGRRPRNDYPKLDDNDRPTLRTDLSRELRVEAAAINTCHPLWAPPKPMPLADVWQPVKRAKRLALQAAKEKRAQRKTAESSGCPRSSKRLKETAAVQSRTGCCGLVGASRSASGAETDASGSAVRPTSAPEDVVPPSANVARLVAFRESGDLGFSNLAPCQRRHLLSVHYPPAHPNRIVEQRPAKCYIGQYSSDGSLFVAAYQDSHVRIYDVDRGWRLRKDVEARGLRWTVTDTALSPDNRFLLYASISSRVHLVNVGSAYDRVSSIANITEVHEELDFQPEHMDDDFAIWSLAWSSNSKEIVAGTRAPGIVLYDVEAERVKSAVNMHEDDINAVAFVDIDCNVIVTGSDDSQVQVLDRRIMRDRARPSGVFRGHTEGITHLHARGDGVHFISNAKDCTIKMWDLRKMAPEDAIDRTPTRGIFNHDYRWSPYPGRGRLVRRDVDDSVMTFWGHNVRYTLIRAYWSPLEATASRFVYSGSADGTIYVFDTITGEVARKLKHHRETVRDCSWHPQTNKLASVSWDGSIVEWGPRAVEPGRLNFGAD